MRNVDRDVLREAVSLADIQDLFTPTFQVDIYARLDQLAERNRALEALAFGTVIMKLVRALMFFMKLLPHARIVMILLGVFMVADRAIQSSSVPSKEEIGEIVDGLGLSEVMEDIRKEIVEQISPWVEQLEDFGANLSQVVLDQDFHVENMTGLVQQLKDIANTSGQTGFFDWDKYWSTLGAMESNFQEMGNQMSNTRILLLEGSFNPVLHSLQAFLGDQTKTVEETSQKVEQFIEKSTEGFVG